MDNVHPFVGEAKSTRHARDRHCARNQKIGIDGGEGQAAVDLYEKVKPEVVLTHDGPDEAVRSLLAGRSAHKELTRTSTGGALNAMLEAHRPGKWIFGHWHSQFRRKIGGTEFRCLPELGWCRIPGDFEKAER